MQDLLLKPVNFFQDGSEGYKEWNQARLKESGSVTNDIDVEEIIHTDINELTIDEYEEKATDGIMTFLKSKNPYDFQDLLPWFVAHETVFFDLK